MTANYHENHQGGLPSTFREPAHPSQRPASTPGDFSWADYGGPYGGNGNEFHLTDYLAIVQRRWMLFAGVFLVCVLLAVVYSHLSTPIYSSLAVLETEKDSGMSINTIGDAISSGFGGGGDNEFFATQIGILKSRTMSSVLVEKMNLADSPEFSGQPGLLSVILGSVRSLVGKLFTSAPPAAPDELIAREGLIKAVQGRIQAKRDGQGRLINVSLEAKTPEFAQEMLQNFVDIYLRSNLDKRRRVNREAGAWLADELKQSEVKLVQSLGSLVDFTTQHGVVSIEEGANHILTFFNKAAEGLVKSKEFRMQLEALNHDGGAGALSMGTGPVKTPDMDQLFNKLASLEAERAQMSEVYSENYPKLLMLKKQIQFLQDTINAKQTRAVQEVSQTAKQQEQLSKEAFEAAKKEALSSSELGVQFAVLKKEADTNEEIFRLLLQKAKELQLNTQVIGNNITCLVPATRPVGSVRPRKMLNLLVGCVLGLVGAVMAVMLAEHLDSSVRDTRELERMNLVNLGMVPNMQKSRRSRRRRSKKFPDDQVAPELQTYFKPTSATSEAFSIIKTSLFLMNPGDALRSILITSSVPGEGKTFIAISLASSVASGAKRVLVIDGDMRKPRASKVLGLKYGVPGLSTVLTNPETPLEQVIHPTPIAEMSMMPCGPLPENPVQLLETDHMAGLLARLREMYDFIVVDSPPVVGFSDARLISRAVDGSILVVKQAHASLELIKTAGATLSVPGASRLLGSVFNNVESSSSRYGYSRYGYYGNYGHYYRYYDYRKYYSHEEEDDGGAGKQVDSTPAVHRRSGEETRRHDSNPER